MKKTRETNTGGVLPNKTVRTVYPVPNVEFNPHRTIQKQHINSQTALYRNRRGRVVWGELR